MKAERAKSVPATVVPDTKQLGVMIEVRTVRQIGRVPRIRHILGFTVALVLTAHGAEHAIRAKDRVSR